MQFTFGDKREAHLLDESVLPVTEKERRRKGKSSISPKMRYGHAYIVGCQGVAQLGGLVPVL